MIFDPLTQCSINSSNSQSRTELQFHRIIWIHGVNKRNKKQTNQQYLMNLNMTITYKLNQIKQNWIKSLVFWESHLIEMNKFRVNSVKQCQRIQINELTQHLIFVFLLSFFFRPFLVVNKKNFDFRSFFGSS